MKRTAGSTQSTIFFGLALSGALLMQGTRALVQGPRETETVPVFQVDPFWPKPLPHNWYFGAVSSVAVDSRDHIWVLHRPRSLEARERGLELGHSRCCVPAPPVVELDPSGTVVQGWGGPGPGFEWLGKTGNEHGIYVDDAANVWVSEANGNGHVVLKFTRTGTFLLQIGELGKTGGSNDPRLLGAPANVWVDTEANDVYVADGYINRRVIVFDATTGAYKRHWGAYGNRPDGAPQEKYDPASPRRQQFSPPVHCVRIARDGLVYVCDRSNNRLQVFRRDGSFVDELIVEKETRDLGPLCDAGFSHDADQRFLYLADCANDTIHIVSRRDLKVVSAFGRKGRHAGELYGPHFIGVDSKGHLYVAEVFGRRLQKFEYKGLSPQP
jgi:hypothetical protein